MYVFKPSKFVRTKNMGSGKMLPLNAIPVKTHKILQLEDDLGCLVFYIVIYSMLPGHTVQRCLRLRGCGVSVVSDYAYTRFSNFAIEYLREY